MGKYFSIGGGLVGLGIGLLFGQLHLPFWAGAGLFSIYMGLIITYYELKENQDA